MKITEDFAALARGNVANILNFYYQQNKPIPKEIIKTIKFNEEIQIIFETIGKKRYDQRHHIQESNIINCLKYLDFPVYKDYMTVDWILDTGFSGSNAFIRTAIGYNKKEALQRSYELIQEEIKKPEVIQNLGNRDMEYLYFRDVLDLTFLLRNHLESRGNAKDLQDTIDFFKKNLSLFSEYYHERAKLWKSENTVDFNAWHKNHDKFKIFFSNFNMQSSLNEALVENKKFFFLCKEAFQQYGENEKNPFINKDLLLLAMKNGNLDFINLVARSNKIDKQDLMEVFDKYLSYNMDKFYDNFNNTHESTVFYPSLKKIKQIHDCLKKLDVEIKYGGDGLLCLMCCDDVKVKDFISENVQNPQDIIVFIGVTVGQLSFMNKYIKQLSEPSTQKNNIKTERDQFLKMFPFCEMFVSEKAKELFPSVDLTPTKKEEAIQKLSSKEESCIMNHNLSTEDIITLIRKDLLDESLSNDKTISPKRVKL